jgi:hypothetical protein
MPMIELVMAGGPGFPQGSPDRRYRMQVTLTPTGELDSAAWECDPAVWPAERQWPGDHRPGDVQYDPDTGWWLSIHRTAQEVTDPACSPLQTPIRGAGPFRPGEYVTLRELDGTEYSYRVVSVV